MARKGLNIYKRKDGRFEGRYIKGRKPDGNPQFGWIYGSSYESVKELLEPLRFSYRHTKNNRETMLFKEYAYRWLHDKQKIKPTTRAAYERQIRLHLNPVLGEIYLYVLTKKDVQQFVDSLTKKGLGSRSVRSIFVLLSSILDTAAEQILEENICTNIRLPEQEYAYKNRSVLKRADQKKLEHVARKSKYGVLLMLAVYTGMRVGEISALRWSNVDLEEQTIQVSETAQRMKIRGGKSKTVVHFGAPKSRRSIRKIPLCNTLTEYLKKCKKTAQSEYVVSCKGGYAEPRVCQYRFAKLLKEAQLSHINFHGLRHTYATRCAECNIDISTISAYLGHSSIQMTQRYITSLSEHQRTAVKALDNLYQSAG